MQSQTMRVVLDSTVYVAAALTEGASHRIVKAFIEEGFFTAIVSHNLLTEIRGVLLRPRFSFSQDLLDPYLTAIFLNTELHPDVPNPPCRCRDPTMTTW